MLKINNHLCRGYIQEKSITAVLATRENVDMMADWYGPWKVIIRADGHEYVYCYCANESLANEEVDEIVKMISRV